MSAAERDLPETLSPYTAAAVVLTAIFFSHFFPMLLAVLAQWGAFPGRKNYWLALASLYLPLLLASGIIGIFLRHHRVGVSRLTRTDCICVVAGWLISVFGCGAITAGWKSILLHFAVDFSQKQTLLEIAGKCPSHIFGFLLIFTVLLVPVFEEITFRWALYDLLLPAGKWTACIAGAAIFGALHFFLLGAPALFFFGIVLQVSLLKTKNLVVPMLIHALFNALAMWGAYLGN